jgi:hypothetical protein
MEIALQHPSVNGEQNVICRLLCTSRGLQAEVSRGNLTAGVNMLTLYRVLPQLLCYGFHPCLHVACFLLEGIRYCKQLHVAHHLLSLVKGVSMQRAAICSREQLAHLETSGYVLLAA